MLSYTPPQLLYVRDGIVHAGAARAAGSAPSVSADGRWLAFSSGRSGNPELYVLRLPGGRAVRVTFTPRAAEADPDWSPDGRRLVYSAGGSLHVTTLDGTRTRLLVRRGRNPAWSPDGRQIAYERGSDVFRVGPDGLGVRRLVASAAQPAWSRGGRLAFVREGNLLVGERLVERDARAPAWSPDGSRIAFERGRAVRSVSVDGRQRAWLRVGGSPSWRWTAGVRELLPDLDQLGFREVRIDQVGTRFLLGFTSAVKNVGEGPMRIVATRPRDGPPVLTAAQLITLANGRLRRNDGVGLVRFRDADDHHHWHYLAFERFELRTPDNRLVVRDRKSGFCLVDRHGPEARAVFTDNCAPGDRAARRVSEGVSPGFTDIYPAFFHGQNLDITAVPAGTYVLVQRANPLLLLREADYTNNAASIALRLRWVGGRRRVRVLRVCSGTDRCVPR